MQAESTLSDHLNRDLRSTGAACGLPAQWQDWRWQLKHAVRGAAPQLAEYGLEPRAAARVAARYPVKIAPYALSLLTPGDVSAPLNLQALPHPAELLEEEGIGGDPFDELGAASVCHGVKRRFKDRVLIMAHDQCALNCRHCTRKHLLREAEVVRTEAQLAAAAAWIRAHGEVREVLISGGDPLLLEDAQIIRLVAAFAALPQVDAVRIGTRALSSLPMRITPELAAGLGRFKKVWINTQFNHSAEMTPAAAEACALLVDSGIPLSNQSVLLKGVNDSVEELFALCSALQRARVRPYYLFLCDPVAGVAHFRVSRAVACALEHALAERIGGLAMPRFVMDVPGALRKMPIGEGRGG